MSKTLKILLTVDPELPVPPEYYGGVERIVDLLARGLVERGHNLDLLAHRDSKSAGHLIPWPGLNSRSLRDSALNTLTLDRVVREGDYDLVHSCSRLAYLLPILFRKIPKVMTYHRPISERSVRWGRWLSSGTLEFTAVSHWMAEHVRDFAPWHTVYNGVPLHAFEFQPDVPADAPLAFLGRVEAIKGPHLAIEIARRAGRRLVIAGNIPEGGNPWFDEMIAPHIDGDAVTYVGPVDDVQKNEVLGHAAAFLMPILWDEPFGIVMAEAMACGTPVLGFPRGAVPELVEDGVTGYVCEDVQALVEAVSDLPALDRRHCRRRVEDLFSDTALVEGYLKVYHAVCHTET